MKLTKYIFFFLILINFSDSNADDRDIQLNRLFNELKINNTSSTYRVEQKIWKI